MHNWWIAALVASGVWTEEQAQHVSDNIKTTIHKDNFHDALGELKAILSKGDFSVPSITKLESDIASLEAKIKLLTQTVADKVETPSSKTVVAKETKTP